MIDLNKRVVLPYFNFYISDYMSYGRKLSDHEIVEILNAVCELCTYGSTEYIPQTPYQSAFFDVFRKNAEKSMAFYITRIRNGQKHKKKE